MTDSYLHRIFNTMWYLGTFALGKFLCNIYIKSPGNSCQTVYFSCSAFSCHVTAVKLKMLRHGCIFSQYEGYYYNFLKPLRFEDV